MPPPDAGSERSEEPGPDTPWTTAWFHIVLNTRGTWLHGDPRGFRDRDHRIHSSGDYRNPPPSGEHAGLHAWYQRRLKHRVVLQPEHLETVARALIEKAQREQLPLATACVGCVHAHLLIHLPRDEASLKRALGKLKQFASLRAPVDGGIWAAGATVRRIKDRSHQVNTFHYITTKQEKGSVAWTQKRGFFVVG